jgi:hypothetical protein
MRFTKIEGTTVAVHVSNAEEAKAALKELRHKKKELKFLRSALAKQHKASRPSRGKAKSPPKSGLETFFDDMRWGIASMLASKPEPAPAKPRKPTAAEIERELRDLDEILHNLEGCMLQLQGKLLTRKG